MWRSSIVIIGLFTAISGLISCNPSKKEKERKPVVTLPTDTGRAIRDWINYYKALDSSFNYQNFEYQNADTQKFMKGCILGSFDTGFNPVYRNFLVYNTSKTQYIDFDSYQWFPDENGEMAFSPDQEINLVDIKSQTVTRIGFNGPSQWVENAFWESDSTVVLLENTFMHRPLMRRINIFNGHYQVFSYPDSLGASQYSEIRYRQKMSLP